MAQDAVKDENRFYAISRRKGVRVVLPRKRFRVDNLARYQLPGQCASLTSLRWSSLQRSVSEHRQRPELPVATQALGRGEEHKPRSHFDACVWAKPRIFESRLPDL